MSDAATAALDPAQRETVRTAVLAAAASPQSLAKLKTAAKATVGKKSKKAAEAVVDEMIAAGELHKQTGAASAPYGANKPPLKNDPEKVRLALIAAAESPQTLANLIKAAVGATKADKSFVTDEANKLVAAGQLHKQSAAAKAPYAATAPKPPHALDVAPGKAAFTALVKAAKKVREVASGVPLDEVVQRLRAALADEVATPRVVSPPVAPPASPSAVAPKPAAVAPPLTPERIRAALKDAYGELILYPEFEDKLVEVRRLYHEAKRTMPDLSVAQFHQELEHLQGQRAIELHALNEVQHAKEPELAIRRNDRLLYFVMWGK